LDSRHLAEYCLDVPAATAALAQPPEQLREADLQDLGDLAGGVHCDVDPAAFEQAHVSAVEVARLGETLLGESLRRADLADPRSQAFLKLCRV
jgi:hypothetical protein